MCTELSAFGFMLSMYPMSVWDMERPPYSELEVKVWSGPELQVGFRSGGRAWIRVEVIRPETKGGQYYNHGSETTRR